MIPDEIIVDRTKPTLYLPCWNGCHDWCWFRWVGEDMDMVPVYEPIEDEV